jgi:hypothetical protein
MPPSRPGEASESAIGSFGRSEPGAPDGDEGFCTAGLYHTCRVGPPPLAAIRPTTVGRGPLD